MEALVVSIVDLQFETTVRASFDVLDQHGFQCVSSSPTEVVYRSGTVEVAITLDRLSYEIAVELRLLHDEHAIHFSRLIALAAPEEAKRWQLVQASSREKIESIVPQLAALLLQYGRAALRGDAKVFDEMRLVEELDAQRTTRDLQVRQARRRAENAWRAKNYSEVVSALAPIQEYLAPSELMKFDYAKRHRASEPEN
jgi:hypothetical protein